MSRHIALYPLYQLNELTDLLIRETIQPPRTFFVNPTRLIQGAWGRWRLEPNSLCEMAVPTCLA